MRDIFHGGIDEERWLKASVGRNSIRKIQKVAKQMLPKIGLAKMGKLSKS